MYCVTAFYPTVGVFDCAKLTDKNSLKCVIIPIFNRYENVLSMPVCTINSLYRLNSQ